MNNLINIETLNQKVCDLYEEYKHDEYMLNKLSNHINNDLSALLINAKNLQKSREDRRLLLTEGHNKFVNDFINKNTYFYCSTTEIFFKYDNNHYTIIKEDDIIHAVLSSLSHRDNKHQLEYYQQQLLPWKFKIKISIIKQIRDKSLFTSIPESITIQRVINMFYEQYFYTRNEVKYILTILGDNILKKNNNNIYLISPAAKPLLRLLENQGGKYFGHIPLQTPFRYKYHDHEYNDCRLLTIKNNKSNMEEVPGQNIGISVSSTIDIFVVCCYYSNRYGSADQYLDVCEDSVLKNHVLYLKNNDQKTIVDKFIDSKIQHLADSTISMKNMLYLCKCYLDENNISGLIFTLALKTILKEKLTFNEETDSFYGYTSLGLPLVSNFVKFWDFSMKEDINEYFLEIDEICILFKQSLNNKSTLEINESSLLHLIKHFYPDIIIENNKYIYGITCNTWCKKSEIKNFLTNCNNVDNLTGYDLYVEYTKKNNKKNTALTVNKSYFDLFMADYNMGES